MRTSGEIDLDATWERWVTSRDETARDALVKNYLPFVRFLADQLGSQVDPYLRSELYSLGTLGLLDAIERFDPGLGNRFETYGGTRIRGEMLDGVRRMGALPRGARQRRTCVIRYITPVDFQSAVTPSGARFQDCLEDSDQPSASDALELIADHEEVVAAIEALPERERRVIRQHYYEGTFLKAIGTELGITESRVCQIHRRALKMLERSLLRLRAA
ncbi:MAG: polymerase sigma factor FliA [Actinomycetota bacterium]|nr:polymerase sigma factor FliA [Actinomycetota bacterium]